MADILAGSDVVLGTFRSAKVTGSGRLVVEGRRSGLRGLPWRDVRPGRSRAATGDVRRLLDRGHRAEARHPHLLDLLGESVSNDAAWVVASRVERRPVDVAELGTELVRQPLLRVGEDESKLPRPPRQLLG